MRLSAVLLVLVLTQGGCGIVNEFRQNLDGNVVALRQDHGGGARSQSPGYVVFHDDPFDDAALERAMPLLKAYGVRDLNLNGRDVTDASIDRLLQLKGLRRLQLQGTAISFQGIERLGSLKHLRVLVVTEGLLSSEQLAELQRTMPGVQIQEEWITIRRYDPNKRCDSFVNFRSRYAEYQQWVP